MIGAAAGIHTMGIKPRMARGGDLGTTTMGINRRVAEIKIGNSLRTGVVKLKNTRAGGSLC